MYIPYEAWGTNFYVVLASVEPLEAKASEIAMEVDGKSVVAGPTNVIFLSTILGRDGSTSVHKCDWKCQNEHVCANMYCCKLTGLTHICDKNCDQRICMITIAPFVEQAERFSPYTSRGTGRERVRRKLESENSSADSCSSKFPSFSFREILLYSQSDLQQNMDDELDEYLSGGPNVSYPSYGSEVNVNFAGLEACAIKETLNMLVIASLIGEESYT
ncbi:hypothetical protein Prudu_007869, partial [Prunus dulcis]